MRYSSRLKSVAVAALSALGGCESSELPPGARPPTDLAPPSDARPGGGDADAGGQGGDAELVIAGCPGSYTEVESPTVESVSVPVSLTPVEGQVDCGGDPQGFGRRAAVRVRGLDDAAYRLTAEPGVTLQVRGNCRGAPQVLPDLRDDARCSTPDEALPTLWVSSDSTGSPLASMDVMLYGPPGEGPLETTLVIEHVPLAEPQVDIEQVVWDAERDRLGLRAVAEVDPAGSRLPATFALRLLSGGGLPGTDGETLAETGERPFGAAPQLRLVSAGPVGGDPPRVPYVLELVWPHVSAAFGGDDIVERAELTIVDAWRQTASDTSRVGPPRPLPRGQRALCDLRALFDRCAAPEICAEADMIGRCVVSPGDDLTASAVRLVVDPERGAVGVQVTGLDLTDRPPIESIRLLPLDAAGDPLPLAPHDPECALASQRDAWLLMPATTRGDVVEATARPVPTLACLLELEDGFSRCVAEAARDGDEEVAGCVQRFEAQRRACLMPGDIGSGVFGRIADAAVELLDATGSVWPDEPFRVQPSSTLSGEPLDPCDRDGILTTCPPDHDCFGLPLFADAPVCRPLVLGCPNGHAPLEIDGGDVGPWEAPPADDAVTPWGERASCGGSGLVVAYVFDGAPGCYTAEAQSDGEPLVIHARDACALPDAAYEQGCADSVGRHVGRARVDFEVGADGAPVFLFVSGVWERVPTHHLEVDVADCPE